MADERDKLGQRQFGPYAGMTTPEILERRRERELHPRVQESPAAMARHQMQAQPHAFVSEAPHERATKGKASKWCARCAFPESDPVHSVLRRVK